MATYAFLKNNTVQLVQELDPELYANHVQSWDAIIDVTELVPSPVKGWILRGNTLVPVDPLEQQTAQQAFGSGFSLDLVNKMGARNLLLSAQGSSVNVGQVLSSVGVVKSLLETGALKTARGVMQQVAPAFPQYADILAYGIDGITEFLSEKGWDG